MTADRIQTRNTFSKTQFKGIKFVVYKEKTYPFSRQTVCIGNGTWLEYESCIQLVKFPTQRKHGYLQCTLGLWINKVKLVDNRIRLSRPPLGQVVDALTRSFQCCTRSLMKLQNQNGFNKEEWKPDTCNFVQLINAFTYAARRFSIRRFLTFLSSRKLSKGKHKLNKCRRGFV